MTNRPETWWAPLAYSRPSLETPLPPPGEPLRVAFVGQQTYFKACAQEDPTRAIDPTFIDYRDGGDGLGLARQLRDIRPHVVVVFRPEIVPAGILADAGTIVLGILTEPLPRAAEAAVEGHPDLARRLAFLERLDPTNVDRIIAFDPHIIPVVQTRIPVWRAEPLPVSDRLFGWKEHLDPSPRVGFIGRSTPHRETILQPAKHHFDLFHVDHGLHGQHLRDTLATLDVGVNVHNEPYPTFENRVAIHLAAGHLVASEALSPLWGLEPGLDFVEISHPRHLLALLDELSADPSAYDWMRRRGHQKAELFRASRCWARILHDLLHDVSAFGRGITAAATRGSAR
jgi:hypothetical protein